MLFFLHIFEFPSGPEAPKNCTRFLANESARKKFPPPHVPTMSEESGGHHFLG